MHIWVIPVYNATVKCERFCVDIFTLLKYIYLGVEFLKSHNHLSRKSKVCCLGWLLLAFLWWGQGIRLGIHCVDQAGTELRSIHLPPKHHHTHPAEGL